MPSVFRRTKNRSKPLFRRLRPNSRRSGKAAAPRQAARRATASIAAASAGRAPVPIVACADVLRRVCVGPSDPTGSRAGWPAEQPARARCSPLWTGRARAARVAASHRPMRIIVCAALAMLRDRARRARARCVSAILRQHTARQPAHPAQRSCARSDSRMCGWSARMRVKHVSPTAYAVGSYATDEDSGALHRSPATATSPTNGRCAPGHSQARPGWPEHGWTKRRRSHRPTTSSAPIAAAASRSCARAPDSRGRRDLARHPECV